MTELQFPHLLPEPSIICIPPRLLNTAFSKSPRFIDVGAVVDRYKVCSDHMAAHLNGPEIDAIFERQAEMFKKLETNVDMLNAMEYTLVHVLILFARKVRTELHDLCGRDPDMMYEDMKTTAIVPFTSTCAKDDRELAELQEVVRVFNVERAIMALVIGKTAVDMSKEEEA